MGYDEVFVPFAVAAITPLGCAWVASRFVPPTNKWVYGGVIIGTAFLSWKYIVPRMLTSMGYPVPFEAESFNAECGIQENSEGEWVCGWDADDDFCTGHHCEVCSISLCSPDCGDEYCSRTRSPATEELNECMLCAYPLAEEEEYDSDLDTWVKDGKKIQWKDGNTFSYGAESFSAEKIPQEVIMWKIDGKEYTISTENCYEGFYQSPCVYVSADTMSEKEADAVESWLIKHFNPWNWSYVDELHTWFFTPNKRFQEWLENRQCEDGEHEWSNAYVRDTMYEDDGKGYTTFGQRCINCDVERRGTIQEDVDWDMAAESFSAKQKFRHKKTGEIATQISLLDMKNWEKLGAESKFIRPYDRKGKIDFRRDNKGRYRRKLSIPLKKNAEGDPWGYEMQARWARDVVDRAITKGCFSDELVKTLQDEAGKLGMSVGSK